MEFFFINSSNEQIDFTRDSNFDFFLSIKIKIYKYIQLNY